MALGGPARHARAVPAFRGVIDLTGLSSTQGPAQHATTGRGAPARRGSCGHSPVRAAPGPLSDRVDRSRSRQSASPVQGPEPHAEGSHDLRLNAAHITRDDEIMSSMNDFKPPPIYPTARREGFETERLLVRRTVRDDLGPLTPTLEAPDLAQWLGREDPIDPQVFIDAAVAGWEFQSPWTFTIVERATQHVVGFAGISLEPRDGGGWEAEPIIAIAPGSRGQRYSYEAMRGLISWPFSDLECPPGVTLDEVRAVCLPENSAILHVLTRLAVIGMRDLGELEVPVRHPGPGEPRTRTARVFSITREDYRE